MRRAICCACILLLLGSSLAAAQSYTVTDLGTLSGDTVSVGSAINAAGQVVGGTGSTLQHGFFWSTSQGLLDLPPLRGGLFSVAVGINSGSVSVGTSTISTLGPDRAVLWINGKVRDLGTLPGGTSSVGSAINDAGQIAGGSDSGSTDTHAILWSKTTGMRDLGTLLASGGYSLAEGINRYGEVVGQCTVGPGGQTHAFVWTKAHGMKDLGTLPGGANSFAYQVNDLGQIVGFSDSGASYSHAALWTPAHKIQDLGTLANAIASSANGINNSGQVVGYAIFSNAAYHAMIWTQATGMQDLNALIAASSGWTLEFAFAINDSGQITGTGTINGAEHAFLLTPSAN
jgi:probable HAF family extracellular repeat protein